MLTRREMLAAGLASGAAPAGSAESADAAQSRGGNTEERTLKALEEIRDQLKSDAGGNCPELTAIRALQRDFLKGRGKFPDFVEVGVDVWDALTDWHVRTRQPLQVQRTAEGRYAMAVLQTNIVLRHDVSGVYIGPAYAAK
jgi:hypothetical protein